MDPAVPNDVYSWRYLRSRKRRTRAIGKGGGEEEGIRRGQGSRRRGELLRFTTIPSRKSYYLRKKLGDTFRGKSQQ